MADACECGDEPWGFHNILGISGLAKELSHFYWPTSALNCIKLNRLKSTWINILKDN